MPRAVVLLSGGLDSTTTLAVAKNAGYEVFALSVDYGQRHKVELVKAAAVAAHFAVSDHRTVTLDLRAIGGSALTADVAQKLGYKNVTSLVGGYKALVAAGWPMKIGN